MDRRSLLIGAGATIAAGGALHFADATTAGKDAATAANDPLTAGTDAGRPLLGMNLTPVSYYTPSPFIDRLKTSAGEWAVQGGPQPPIGPTGFPTAMGGASAIYTMVSLDPASASRPDRYEILHDGEARFEMPYGKVLFAGRGRTVIEFSGPTSATPLIFRSIGGQPPTKVSLVRQDQARRFAAGEVFTPEFLRDVTGFDTLRFMDWLATNGSTVSDMSVPISALTYAKGVPIEIVIALANATGASPWVCIPHLATDTLVAEIMAKLKRGLTPGIKPVLEYSNEVWNLGFPQARYANEQAAAKWGAGTPGAVYYGYRSGQIAKLARGSGARVALGCQTVQPALADQVWKGVALSGATPQDFSDWTIAAYIAGTLTSQTGPTLDLMARNDIAGAIDNLLNDVSPNSLSVRAMSRIYSAHGKIASARGLRLTAYEGNMHLNALPMFAAQRDQVISFFTAISNDPASVQVLRANLDAFVAAGGELACLFNLSTAPAGGGVFGLLDKPAWGFIRRHLERSAAPSANR